MTTHEEGAKSLQGAPSVDPAAVLPLLEQIPAAIGLPLAAIANAVVFALSSLMPRDGRRRALSHVELAPNGATPSTLVFVLTLDKAAALPFPMVRGPFVTLRLPFHVWDRAARRGRSAAFAARAVAVDLLDQLRFKNAAELQWFFDLSHVEPPPFSGSMTRSFVKMFAELASAVDAATADRHRRELIADASSEDH